MNAGRPRVQMLPYTTHRRAVSPSAPRIRANGSMNASSGIMNTSDRMSVKRMSMLKMAEAR